MTLEWRKDGRHHIAVWLRGSAQVIRDEKEGKISWRWAVFEIGAIIGQGRTDSMPSAKRAAEAAIPTH